MKKVIKKTKPSHKTTKRKAFEGASSIRPNYFARFRFNLKELTQFLKAASGRPWGEIPLAYQCLDDLGYWSLVRGSDIFEWTESLENQLREQFNFLNQIFSYEIGDTVYWAPLQTLGLPREKVVIKEKMAVREGEQDIYRVALIDSETTYLVGSDGLDFWNGTGGSMPIDELQEKIDWDFDKFFLQRLTQFKEALATENFQFDFSLRGEDMRSQQQWLFDRIINHFKISEGDLQQRGRGLGFLACGQGNRHDEELVRAFVFQALGQVFGIKARLWSHYKQGSFHLVTSLGKYPTEWAEGQDFILQNTMAYPIQRSLGEVLRRLVGVGPFGKPESQEWDRPQFETNETLEFKTTVEDCGE